MRLTAFSDFALRTLMRLAAEPERAFTTDEIAEGFAISRHHLAKVVRALVEAGYVSAQRGAGGGLRLAQRPEEIRLGTVLRRMEEGQPMVECFRADGGACRMRAGCRLRMRLARAEAAFFADLDRSTLAEV
ncbi:Rrf2 family transcriptional regulator, partial [Thioclava sp. BHET1]